MMSIDPILDDLMAPDWKYLLEHLHPQSFDTLRRTEGYDEEAWQALLTKYPAQVALTPQLIAELNGRLRETLQTETVINPENVTNLAREAEVAQQDDVVIADGGVVSVPLVVGATIVSLYFMNVVAVIINNTLRDKKEKKQDIPTPADILKHINFAEVVRNIPMLSKPAVEQPAVEDRAGVKNLPGKATS